MTPVPFISMQPTSMVLFPGEARALKEELIQAFRQGDWGRLRSSLLRTIALANALGLREMALRSEGLSDLLGWQAGGRAQAGPRLEALFQSLLDELPSLQDPSVPGVTPVGKPENSSTMAVPNPPSLG
jgi:hypothetical protein